MYTFMLRGNTLYRLNDITGEASKEENGTWQPIAEQKEQSGS